MYDAIIIGGGSGGYACAVRIAQLGGRPLIIERDKIGGCCANNGCIPTKALLKSAKLFFDIKNAARFGIKVDNAQPDIETMFKRVERIVSTTRKGIEFLLKSHKVEVIAGDAKILDANRVEVNGDEFKARNLVVATGSAPKMIPGIVPGDFVMDSDSFFDYKQMPKSVVIVGGGAIGVEFANIFSFLGAETTIVEAMDNIVPTEDIEISIELEKIFKRYGIKIYTKSSANILDRKIEITTGEATIKMEPEKVLVAIGRKPVIDIDAFDNIGIKFNQNGIDTDSLMQTNIENVYAIGDVTGRYLLAHVAIRQGVVAAANIMGGSSRIDYRAVPSCIYTRPEIGSIGLRSRDGDGAQIGKFPFMASGKARADDDKEGFTKLVAIAGKIVGAHMIGGAATELTGEISAFINGGLDLDAISGFIHPHPTFSESIIQALEDINGKAIDLPKGEK